MSMLIERLRASTARWREGTTLEREKRLGSYFIATLAVTALTGFATFALPGKGAAWQQWSYLVHTMQGLILTVLLVAYVYMHFRRTLGLRRPGVALAGILAAMSALAIVLSGLHITIFGQSEPRRAVYWIHVMLGAGATLLLLGHVFLHRLTYPSSRQESKPALGSIHPLTLRSAVRQCASVVAIVGLGTLGYFALPSPYNDVAAIQPYELDKYGPNPFWPSRNETASGGFYDPRRVGASEDCGDCHADIFKQWQASIHAKAASDRAYQTNVNLLAKNKGMAATRYCEGCHAPIPMMSGQLSTGGKLDTHGHMKEGVSCLSCHAMEKVLNTSGVASYLTRPPSLYMFAGYDNPIAKEVHNYLVRLNPSLHRSEMSRAPLGQPEMCATCHAQFMPKEMNDWGWVKMQDDYTAWLNGPFSGQSKHTFAKGGVTRCQDCHFAKQKMNDPSANADGFVSAHRSPGANTAIPFIDGDHEQQRIVTEFLQANRVTVSIDKPNRERPVRNDRFVDPAITRQTESLSYYYLGEEPTLNVVVSNIGVGHDFPGGTSDINEAWVQFVATDAQGRTIMESGAVRDDGDVDHGAYFYRSIPVDKGGRHVWRHDLFRMVGDSFKKVIEPGAADVVSYKLKIPMWAKSPMNLYAVVRYRKLNNRYAQWALNDATIRLPIVDVASDSIKIPLREKPEALEQEPPPGDIALSALRRR